MTYSPEEQSRVTVRRYRGVQKGVDKSDVPIDQFFDLQNFITDPRTGEMRTRDGYASVDGVAYTNAFPLLTGPRGVLLPPYNTPPAPPAGKLQVVANPSKFEVDASTSVAVTFTVYGGAALATSPVYTWDFHYVLGTTQGSDASGSVVTQSHTYVNADVPASNSTVIYVRVKLTGDDTKEYASWCALDISRINSVTWPPPPPPPPPPPVDDEVTAAITVSPGEVKLGSSANLNWSTSNATQASISWPSNGGGSGAISLNGQRPVTPTAVGVYSYPLSASGDLGSDSATCALSVIAGDPDEELEYEFYSMTLEAVPPVVMSEEGITLLAKCFLTTKYVDQDETTEPADFPSEPGLLLVSGDQDALDTDSLSATVSGSTCTFVGATYALPAGLDIETVRFRAYLDQDVFDECDLAVIMLGVHIHAEIVDAGGSPITEVPDQDDFYIRLTAHDADDEILTSFAEDDVAAGWEIVTEAAGLAARGVSVEFTGVCPTWTWDDGDAAELRDDLTIPADLWLDGTAGCCLLKCALTLPYEYPSPPDNVPLYQDVQFFGRQYRDDLAFIPDQVRVMGASYLEIELLNPADDEPVTDVYSETAFKVVVTVKRPDGATDSTYDGDVVTIRCIDYQGNLIEEWAGVALASGIATKSDATMTLAGGVLGHSVTFVAFVEEDPNICEYEEVAATPNEKADSLVITAISDINRDVDFSISVQAVDGSGNLISDANDEITITLNGVDAADKFTSPTPDAVSYTANLVNGVYTITSQRVTGGSGTDLANSITVSAAGYSSDTTPSFTIAPAPTPLYEIPQDGHPSVYIGTSEAQADRATARTNALATFDADNSLGTSFGPFAMWTQGYKYVEYGTGREAHAFAGILSFSGITPEIKAAAVSARFTNCLVYGADWNKLNNNLNSLRSGYASLFFKFSESGSLFASGAALRAGTPDVSFSDTTINALQVAAGATPPSFARITLDCGAQLAEFISEMTGNTLYLWVWTTVSDVGEVPEWHRYGMYSYAYANATYHWHLEVLG